MFLFLREAQFFSTGRLASFQARKPPPRTTALSYPRDLAVPRQRCASAPVAHTRIRGTVLFFTTSGRRCCSWPTGTLRAPTMWPAANSSASPTSTTTALSRLIICTATPGATPGRAPAARPGASSRVPETTAISTSAQLCARNGKRCSIPIFLVTPGRCRATRDSRMPGFSPHPADHAQARPDPPRRIDLEPGKPLHGMDRRGPHAAGPGAGSVGRPAAEGGGLRLRPVLHERAQARHPHAVARSRRDGPHLAAGGALLAAQ